MLNGAARGLLAGTLLTAAALKLVTPGQSRAALATFGIRAPVKTWAVWGVVVALELALAAGVAIGRVGAEYGAAVVLLAFALLAAWALVRGRRGAPCGCLGSSSRLGSASVARNVTLAGAFVWLPTARGGGAVAVALAAAVGLGEALLAAGRGLVAARERRVPMGALEVVDEGPPLRRRSPLAERFDTEHGERLRVAAFVSDGCSVCRELEPALGALAEHPLVALRVFDERRDADAWREADVPGSPFAVALDAGGSVLAKATFNTADQLESVLATAERRRARSARNDRSRRPVADVEPLSRRGLLARAGEALAAVGAGGAIAALVKPGDAQAFHFCGHIYTTGSCPHPTGLPRVDIHGYPLRAKDGRAVDDLGRLVDAQGRPVDERGHLLLDPDGRPLPSASRSRVCVELTAERYRLRTRIDGSWYRCCGGHVRRLIDCCAYTRRRINGDAALTGYCYGGRKVFCVHYYDTRVRC